MLEGELGEDKRLALSVWDGLMREQPEISVNPYAITEGTLLEYCGRAPHPCTFLLGAGWRKMKGG